MTQNYVVPSQMSAIEVINPGKQSQLQQVTVAVPELKAGQVLVKVAAAGVNRADLLQRYSWVKLCAVLWLSLSAQMIKPQLV